MIYRWVNKFRTHGTVHNLNRKDTNGQSHSGRPKSSRTPHNVAAVRDSVVHSPSKSVRRRSQELGINRESMRRILIADLHMYPCRIQIKQKFTTTWWSEWSCASGIATRLTLCRTFLTMSGFRTRHIFCCQVTWTLRTTSSGLAHPLSTVCKDHYTLWSALPGLHLQTWHHWTILVRKRQRAKCTCSAGELIWSIFFERQWNKEFLTYRLETLEMSATQTWPNVAEVLCQSKYNFGSYSIFVWWWPFFCVTLYLMKKWNVFFARFGILFISVLTVWAKKHSSEHTHSGP